MMALWTVVGWLSASVVMAATLETGNVLAPTHYYAGRSALVGMVLGGVGAPLWSGGGIARFAVSRKRQWVIRMVQGAVLGVMLGLVGTFALLYIWPNGAQNTRLEALKWGGFFWYNYWWVLTPASVFGGVISAIIAVYVDPSRYLPQPGSEP